MTGFDPYDLKEIILCDKFYKFKSQKAMLEELQRKLRILQS